MNLPGNNQIVLCGASLIQIVQKHLNENSYTKEPTIRVTEVKADTKDYGTSYVFQITTDPEK